MTNIVKPRGYNSNRGSSNAIWHDCPFDLIRGQGKGAWVDEDFDKIGLLTSATTIASLVGLGWSAFGSTGATQQPDDASSIVLTESDDNEATSIFMEQHPFQISQSHGPLWYESRLKINSITTVEVGFFAGLMDTTAITATVPLTATSALADVDLIGFHKPEADTTTFDFSYNSSSAGSTVVVNDGTATIAADTFVKVGFKVSPKDWTVTSFINGVKQATQCFVNTGTQGAANGFTIVNGTRTAAAGFPNADAMGLAFSVICGSANDAKLTVDWVRCYQLDPTGQN